MNGARVRKLLRNTIHRMNSRILAVVSFSGDVSQGCTYCLFSLGGHIGPSLRLVHGCYNENYIIATSLTSNINVEYAGMGPLARVPYPTS